MWAAGPLDILLPDRAGTKHERRVPQRSATDQTRLLRTPSPRVRRTLLPRTRVVRVPGDGLYLFTVEADGPWTIDIQ